MAPLQPTPWKDVPQKVKDDIEKWERYCGYQNVLRAQIDAILATAPPDLPPSYIADIGIRIAFNATHSRDELEGADLVWKMKRDECYQRLTGTKDRYPEP